MYELWVSRNCGMTFTLEQTGKSPNEFRSTMQQLDGDMLRWYVMKDGEVCQEYVCKIYIGIFSAIGAIQ